MGYCAGCSSNVYSRDERRAWGLHLWAQTVSPQMTQGRCATNSTSATGQHRQPFSHLGIEAPPLNRLPQHPPQDHAPCGRLEAYPHACDFHDAHARIKCFMSQRHMTPNKGFTDKLQNRGTAAEMPPSSCTRRSCSMWQIWGSPVDNPSCS